jgi:hypothetical protein
MCEALEIAAQEGGEGVSGVGRLSAAVVEARAGVGSYVNEQK